MVGHLVRSLLHAFFSGKVFYNTKTVEQPIIKNVNRILSCKSRKSRLSTKLNSSKIYIKPEMPKVKPGYYAVSVGRKPGVYQSWEECEKQVKKYPNAKHKKFNTLQEAEAFIKEGNNKKVELFIGKSTKEKLSKLSKHSIPSSSVQSPVSNVSNGKTLRVWTDGSSLNNGKHGARAGIGVYWGKDDPRNVSERLPGLLQTNNRAEIMAVIRALETCPVNDVPLEIRTDSQYTMKAFNSWISKWERNGWKTSHDNKEVKNKELFQRLMKLVRTRSASVIITYVPGHAGVKENEEADQLANLGAMMDAVDDAYDCGEDNDEKLEITEDVQNFEIPEQILLNNFECNYNVA